MNFRDAWDSTCMNHIVPYLVYIVYCPYDWFLSVWTFSGCSSIVIEWCTLIGCDSIVLCQLWLEDKSEPLIWLFRETAKYLEKQLMIELFSQFLIIIFSVTPAKCFSYFHILSPWPLLTTSAMLYAIPVAWRKQQLMLSSLKDLRTQLVWSQWKKMTIKHTLKAQVVPAEGALIMILYNTVIKLKAFHYFAVLSKRIGQPARSQDFTVEMLEFIQEVKKELHDHKNAADESPRKPGALKSLGKWHTWWEKFDGYLSQTTGAVEISLNYIYWAHQQVTDEMHAADYVMNDERYYMITVLEGAHYREDNKCMYEELQALTIDGPGWTFIKNFQRARNGCTAILALKAKS